VTQTLELGGWVLAIGALAAAAIARYRMASLAEAVARTCHELRGPLTAVRLGLTLTFRSEQPADARLRAIELELGRAALALEDLAEVWQRPVAAARAGSMGSAERIDIGQLVADSVEAARASARAQGVELRLLEGGARPAVLGDRLRLAQAIGNLIANAVEHGGGVVEIGWSAGPATVSVEVVDEGPGLPAPIAELARRGPVLWSASRPGLSGRRRHRAGSRRGHGLAIASTVAAAHGGRLAAAPSDRGARLVLELPSAENETVRTPAG
jgi:signal transduction histidine kinase